MALDVRVESTGVAGGRWSALNEAVIEKARHGRVVRLDVEINGGFFTSYAADGLIVATPTGSTAYSFSARGPIVSPRHRCLLLTPVSPHMLFDRSLVLDPDEELRFTVTDNRAAVLTLDGREVGELAAGDVVVCTAGTDADADRDLRPARLPPDPEGQVRVGRPMSPGPSVASSSSDLGIIDELQVVLGEGLTAITGETGAGKTLVVGALELLLGGRADPGLVRDGADEARVEGRFVGADGDEVVLARVVSSTPGARSRAYINGRLATAGELSERGAELVELHGQHTHHSLLTPAEQRSALDHAAGEPAHAALAEYRDARAEVRDHRRCARRAGR